MESQSSNLPAPPQAAAAAQAFTSAGGALLGRAVLIAAPHGAMQPHEAMKLRRAGGLTPPLPGSATDQVSNCADQAQAEHHAQDKTRDVRKTRSLPPSFSNSLILSLSFCLSLSLSLTASGKQGIFRLG